MSKDNKSKETKKDTHEHESWYKWGVLVLYLEMATAILVTLYSFYMAFTGSGGFPGKH